MNMLLLSHYFILLLRKIKGFDFVLLSLKLFIMRLLQETEKNMFISEDLDQPYSIKEQIKLHRSQINVALKDLWSFFFSVC